jgi:hypothetical protein
VAYAVQLIDPDAPSFAHVMRRIAYKHVSLGIRPEQYTIVARYLLGAVAEVLGDAVTAEVAAAWTEVYWLFAAQLIAEEARLYQQAGVDPARPLRTYRVVRRLDEALDIVSFMLGTMRRRPAAAEHTRPVRVGVRGPARRVTTAAAVHGAAPARGHAWTGRTTGGGRIGRCGCGRRAQHRPFRSGILTGSGVGRSWADSSTSTRRQPETADQAP